MLGGCSGLGGLTGEDHTYDFPGGEQAAGGGTTQEQALDEFGIPVASQQDAPPPPSANVFGEVPGRQTTARASVSEAGFQQHTFIDEGYDNDVSLSPDGRYIVYASTRHSQSTDVYLQKVDGLSVTQLTSDDAEDAFPVFSPDGRNVAFASSRSGSWDIYIMDRSGKKITQVTSGPAQDMHPSFSPDGRRIVYCSLGTRGQWELWVVDLQSSERKMIGVGLFPTWGPQRTRDVIAFQRARQRGTRWFSLWTLELKDGEASNVTEVAVSTNAAIVSPTWSPDGQRLAFTTIVEPGTVDERGRPTGQQDIWTVDLDGTNRHRLTDGRGINCQPAWSIDGRIYFVSNRGGTECIWSVQGNSKPLSTATTAGE